MALLRNCRKCNARILNPGRNEYLCIKCWFSYKKKTKIDPCYDYTSAKISSNRFLRPCVRCGNNFRPVGPFARICGRCRYDGRKPFTTKDYLNRGCSSKKVKGGK
jgi:hypothetical protein